MYITKNGKGDMVVISIETYEKLIGKFTLYKLLNEGLEAIENKKTVSFEEGFKDIEKNLPMKPYNIV